MQTPCGDSRADIPFLRAILRPGFQETIMKRHIFFPHWLALALCIPAAARPLSAAEPKEQHRPVIVLSYFGQQELPVIISAARRSQLLPTLPLYIGHYGINQETAAQVHSIPNALYAPLFTPTRSKYAKRLLNSSDLEKLTSKYAGPIPADMTAFSFDKQLRWGLELGRRMRDSIRLAKGVRVDSWQLDEISHTASDLTKAGAAWRTVLAGVVHGLAYGRPELLDKPMMGLVFIDRPLSFASLPDLPDTRRLMWELNHGAAGILGEEYPSFNGDPKAKARTAARAQQSLLSGGGSRTGLGRKYIPTLTPGYNHNGGAKFLYGNVDNCSDAWVDQWRTAYITARAATGVAGLAEFNFSGNNGRPAVINAAIDALGEGVLVMLCRIKPEWNELCGQSASSAAPLPNNCHKR